LYIIIYTLFPISYFGMVLLCVLQVFRSFYPIFDPKWVYSDSQWTPFSC